MVLSWTIGITFDVPGPVVFMTSVDITCASMCSQLTFFRVPRGVFLEPRSRRAHRSGRVEDKKRAKQEKAVYFFMCSGVETISTRINHFLCLVGYMVAAALAGDNPRYPRCGRHRGRENAGIQLRTLQAARKRLPLPW